MVRPTEAESTLRLTSRAGAGPLAAMDLASLSTLEEQLDALPSTLRDRLAKRSFDPAQLIAWAADDRSADARNRITGEVKPVPVQDLASLPAAGTDEHTALAQRGEAILAAGQLAVCVLAGGMATRMGGVVKSLVEVVDGHTFLDLRLREMAALARRHGRTVPLWLMTSEPTDGPIREALREGGHDDAATFEQHVSLRLADDAPRLWLDDDGQPSVYATGHGDLPSALVASGQLEGFVEGGGRYVWISNIDNLGARVDPALLAAHADAGNPVTVEVVDKHAGDKGGGPVLHDGAPIICEHFRLPLDFDADQVPVFNTNTFIIDAKALLELDFDWTYVRVNKQVRGRPAVQFERLLGEITVPLRPRFAHVSREGEHSRFLPVKSHDDLAVVADQARRIAASLDD